MSLTPSTSKPYWACPHGACEAIIEPGAVRRGARYALPSAHAGRLLEGGGVNGGFDPQDLQAAYAIPTSGGETQTIAVVDAYADTAAANELAKYRRSYGLPQCTVATGCFRKVGEYGLERSYSTGHKDWEVETALDLEMASAACPHCHLLLVESESEQPRDTAQAVDTAARLGATEISNSYGYPEEYEGWCESSDCEQFGTHYAHPGVFVTASAGDTGYDDYAEGFASPEFPSASPNVVSVGGTSLRRMSGSRGFAESVWSEPALGLGSGSGCSHSEPKPIWQVDTGCTHRTANDIAAVGACETPVSIYSAAYRGWVNVCGTSVGAPLIAGIEAHASEYARSLPGADAFYADPAAANDVTEGANGVCTPEAAAYLCQAQPGYDAPTGNGTPSGPLTLAAAAPFVATGPVSSLGGGNATLNGNVDPQSAATTYQFEFGSTTSYGSSVPVPAASAGNGAVGLHVSEAISSLQPETTYHYRLVASSPSGTSYGNDAAFSTAPPTVTGVQPATGPTDGGTAVTISGTNLLGATSVAFGSKPASFKVVSDESIEATAPRGFGTADVTVTTPAAVSATSGADQFSYVQGPVLAWGDNADGQLGDGNAVSSTVPIEVQDLSDPTELAAGGEVSLALNGDGSVLSWGSNFYGELGDGTPASSNTPVHVCAPGVTSCPNGPYLSQVKAIAAGLSYALALLDDGTVVAWGNNYHGELGIGSTRNTSAVPTPVCLVMEEPCSAEHRLKDVVAIAAGTFQGLAVKQDGTVVSWGLNDHGQLGDGTSVGPERCDENYYPCSRIPVPVSGLSNAVAVAGSLTQGYALLADGSVRSWGENEAGQLGNGTDTDSSLPTAVCAPGQLAPCQGELRGVREITASWTDGHALMADGTVMSWGADFEGDLGQGERNGPEVCVRNIPCSRSPVTVKDLSNVVAISSEGVGTVLALLKDGSLMSWSTDHNGALGNGTTATLGATLPVHVCAAGSSGPCPGGPYLSGEVTAFAGGDQSLVAFATTGPRIIGIQPEAGPHAGGTTVHITGERLSGASSVQFGGVPASETNVVSDKEITAVSPPGVGTVDVAVTTAEGTSRAHPGDHFTFEAAPTVAAGTATRLGQRAAALEAPVDPQGASVETCQVEYGTSTTYGSITQCTGLPTGTMQTNISASLTALEPATTYHFRVVASNSEGVGYGPDAVLTTLPANPPSAVTEPPSLVGQRAATVDATVNPEGEAITECHFQYGTTTTYDAEAPCSPQPGSGATPVDVAASLAALRPSTIYHYRIVAADADGTTYGAEATFETRTPTLPELGRCIKLAGAQTGAYVNASCLKPSRGEDTGGFEWQPWPAENDAFSVAAGAVNINAGGSEDVSCKQATAVGRYVGQQRAVTTLTLNECRMIDGGGKCASENAKVEEIRSGPLEPRLGMIKAGTTPSVGLELTPESEPTLANFKCGPQAVSVSGSAIGAIAPINMMTSRFTARYRASGANQVPEAFEAGLKEYLTLDLRGEARQAALTMTAAIANAEQLEIKASP